MNAEVTPEQHQVYLDELLDNWANNEWLKTLEYPPVPIPSLIVGSITGPMTQKSNQIWRIYIELVDYRQEPGADETEHKMIPVYHVKFGYGSEKNFTKEWKYATSFPVPIIDAKHVFDNLVAHKLKHGFTMIESEWRKENGK